ncbi:PIG-L deacetylase family protein [Gryllotalpicola protaetiae]|uniref:PIG-L deacetylase family protein n=1 Tax=Gryllotalpicola protaetiae TaxID=2419771 RepID=UPI0013C4E276|nr:PIG-L family deacetylase [Gryllotalpicola protaetiae]
MPVALVIHAHPDDEVFATAAWMRELATTGWTVRNVIATGGEAAELAKTRGDVEAARRQRLAKFERALDLLGSDSWEWLDRKSSWLDSAAHPERAVAAADSQLVTSHVRRALAQHKPGVILTVGADGLTGHPDHIAIHHAVRDAVRADGIPSDGAWGARLHANDIAAAKKHVTKELGKKAALGTGRTAGASHTLIDIDAAPVAKLRRQLLDVYSPGLGTKPLTKVAKTNPGDSGFLRAHFDASRWVVERYEAIS